jgi:serine/threonine protein kinase
MASVYRATVSDVSDPLHGKPLAVKVLHEHLSDDGDFIRMFKDEGRIMQRFSHPNIIVVHEVGEVAETGKVAKWYFIAMERVDGHSLAAVLKAYRDARRIVPKAAIYEVLRQSLKALIYVHTFKGSGRRKLGIVHRDVSPHNILISEQGAVKLVDFGIARGEHRSDRTRTGTVKGKMHYMAPEQAAGKRVSAKADLYGLGAVAYEALTSRSLFGPLPTEVLRQRAVRGEIELTGAFKQLPQDVQVWLRKALAVDVDERFQSAEAMLAAMDNLKSANSSRFKPDVMQRLLELPDPKDSAARPQRLFVEDVGAEAEAHTPVGGGRRKLSQTPQRPISGVFMGIHGVTGLRDAAPNERLGRNTGVPRDWSTSQQLAVRPSSSALEVVRTRHGDNPNGRATLRTERPPPPLVEGVGNEQRRRKRRPAGTRRAPRLDVDAAAVRMSEVLAIKAAGGDPSALQQDGFVVGEVSDGAAHTAVDDGVHRQSRVIVEQQHRMAVANFVAVSCVAMLMFATLLEVWNAQISFPSIDETTFSGWFDDGASTVVSDSASVSMVSQTTIRAGGDDVDKRLNRSTRRPMPRTADIRNDTFLPRPKAKRSRSKRAQRSTNKGKRKRRELASKRKKSRRKRVRAKTPSLSRKKHVRAGVIGDKSAMAAKGVEDNKRNR